MNKKTIALIGGHSKETFEKMLKGKGDFEVLFHDAKIKNNKGKSLEPVIKKADMIVIMIRFCCHEAMKEAKKIAKNYRIPITFIDSVGSSQAVDQAVFALQVA